MIHVIVVVLVDVIDIVKMIVLVVVIAHVPKNVITHARQWVLWEE
jgi:hypothetical protein